MYLNGRNLLFRHGLGYDSARRGPIGYHAPVRHQFTSRLLAVLALVGLIVGPLAPRAALAASDQIIAATADSSSADMPDGMPCCPEKQKNPDCAKDCPFTAVCAGTAFPPVRGVVLAAPTALPALIGPVQAAKLQGLAHGPPARPPKA
jgi:hypothetical protein